MKKIRIALTVLAVIVVLIIFFTSDGSENLGFVHDEQVNILTPTPETSIPDIFETEGEGDSTGVGSTSLTDASPTDDTIISNDVTAAADNSAPTDTTATDDDTISNDVTAAADDSAPTDTPTENNNTSDYVEYRFRNNSLLSQHYEKHGIEMGFLSKEAYEAAASDVINNPDALHKIEAEDGDFVYYVEATNEFVVLSTDGYIRTYFYPSAGIAYYNRQ